jgi:hypothetical protein
MNTVPLGAGGVAAPQSDASPEAARIARANVSVHAGGLVENGVNPCVMTVVPALPAAGPKQNARVAIEAHNEVLLKLEPRITLPPLLGVRPQPGFPV